MTGTDVGSNLSPQIREVGTIDMKLEVVTLPVSDVDWARRFYQSRRWRLDANIAAGDAFRLVQVPTRLGVLSLIREEPDHRRARLGPAPGGRHRFSGRSAPRHGLAARSSREEKVHAPHNWWDWYAAYR